MRYSDRSGGLSGAERERCEALRLQAEDMFSGGISPVTSSSVVQQPLTLFVIESEAEQTMCRCP